MRFARCLLPAAALGFALQPVGAGAHAQLVGASPPPGISAAAPPERIVLSFAEALDPGRSSAALVGPDGHAIPWPSTVSGGTLAVQPRGLPAGAWLLRWAVTGADGARETGDYRFTVAPAALALTGASSARSGDLERAGRLPLLLLGVPLVGLLLLGPLVLRVDPPRRAAAGRRLAALRSALWAVELVALCAFTAGLVAAEGGGLFLVSPAGPPLLVAVGITAALGVAVFDGDKLRVGEPASRPTTLLGRGLGVILLADLVALAEAPGDLTVLVAGTLALTALALLAGVVMAAAARSETGIRRLWLRDLAEGPPRFRPFSVPGAFAHPFRHGPGEAPPPAGPVRTPHPLPAGVAHPRRLDTHYVDLERLLQSLEEEAFTGYVRIGDGGVLGLLALVDGAPAVAFLHGEEVPSGHRAERVHTFAREVSGGKAIVHVVALDAETAWAVVDLLSAPLRFRDLPAPMVDLVGVLEYLRERGLDGTVVVSSPADTGVILVRGGAVHGAYTRDLPQPDHSPRVVLALAADAAAVVEVRIAPRRPRQPPPGNGASPGGPGGGQPGPLWDRYQNQPPPPDDPD